MHAAVLGRQAGVIWVWSWRRGGRRRARSFKEDAEDDDVASAGCLSGSTLLELSSSWVSHGNTHSNDSVRHTGRNATELKYDKQGWHIRCFNICWMMYWDFTSLTGLQNKPVTTFIINHPFFHISHLLFILVFTDSKVNTFLFFLSDNTNTINTQIRMLFFHYFLAFYRSNNHYSDRANNHTSQNSLCFFLAGYYNGVKAICNFCILQNTNVYFFLVLTFKVVNTFLSLILLLFSNFFCRIL